MRQMGLILHHLVRSPKRPDADAPAEAPEVKRQEQRKQARPTVTLRRTTIEEVEIRRQE